MRSGLVAQKIGMSRIFTDEGEHIPVTVLKVDNCQVVAQLTEEKNGYTAVRLGVGTASARASPRLNSRSSRSRTWSRSANWSNSA